MKKIMNFPEHMVSESLRGLCRAHPDLLYHQGFEVVSRAVTQRQVGLISGGGSGHEPAFSGYVGPGMLSAAVAGNIFSSPGPDRILKGLEQADTGLGALAVIMNYSGDVMNFTMAQELAALRNLTLELVVVRDDVATPDHATATGRRGIAGTLFVLKVAGAKAATGAPVQQVKAVAEQAAANVRSIGIAMSSCTLPSVGRPGFVLEEDEIGFGIGIHGEPGVERSPQRCAHDLAHQMTEKIFQDLDFFGCEVAILVNGLGGTPLMELYLLFYEVEKILTAHHIRIHRAFVGNYMTSLDMAGCSLSLIKLDEELKELVDAPCHTPALTIQ